MKTLISALAITTLLFIAVSCTSKNEVELFNGENLDNWTVFVSDETPAESVFWVEDGVINTSGVPHAYIKTTKAYENYKLHLEWRWVAKAKNSGVLLHVTGEDMIWPNCIEAQLMAGNAGDFVLIGKGAGFTIQDSVRIIKAEEKRYAVFPKLSDSSENEAGEWNAYDITVDGDKIKLKVNDILQNKAKETSKTKGHIAIQSEGGPMQFRNIRIVEL